MRTHNIFISHSWKYSNAYNDLVNLLNNRNYFEYRNYSVPMNDPIHTNGTQRELRQALTNKISPSGIVIILAGVYSTHSKWIDEEIEIAKRGFLNPKPILAIRPWAAKRISTKVQYSADLIVGWNTESIISAIRQLD